MEQNVELTEPRTDDEKHVIPAWLQKVREEMDHAIEGMTAEEEIAYIKERAVRYREEMQASTNAEK